MTLYPSGMFGRGPLRGSPTTGPTGAGPTPRFLAGSAVVGAVVGAAAVAVGTALQRVVDASVRRLPAPGRFVVVDGARIHVEVLGADDAPVVVAETGLGGTSADWERTAELLGGSVRLVALARPGLGRSDPGAPPDVAGAVRRLEAVLEALSVTPPVVLVGWSLGGLLDLGVTLVRPDLVSGVVLVDPSHPDEARRFRDPALTRVGRAGLRAMGLGARVGGAALVGMPSRVAYLRASTRNAREPLWQIPSFATSAAGLALARELIAFPDVCDEVGRLRPAHAPIAGSVDGPVVAPGSSTAGRTQPVAPPPVVPVVPVVLLSATHRLTPIERRAWEEMHGDLARWLPGTELRVVEHSGHDIPSDRPDAVAEAIGLVVAAAPVASRP